MEIKNEVDYYSQNLDYGLSIVPPEGFKLAQSYIGYQAPNKAGSIEVRIESDGYEAMQQRYSEVTIKAQGGKLYRQQPVLFGDNERAFYVEYHDLKQRRYRQVLVVFENEKVYHVKAFHRGTPDHDLSSEIRNAIKSVHIGEYSESGLPFAKEFMVERNIAVFTRDNQYPTSDSDAVMTKVEFVDDKLKNNTDPDSYLLKRMAKISDGCKNLSKQNLQNGYILKCNASSDEQDFKGLLFVIDGEDWIFIKCSGNIGADLNEAEFQMINKFIFFQ